MGEAIGRLTMDRACLLVVDFQEKLLPVMEHGPECVEAAGRLIAACAAMRIPMVLTEQYPQGLGPTVAMIRQAMGDAPTFAKLRFSAMTPEVTQAIDATGRRQVVLCGMERHVCVQQTALDLLSHGHEVWVCADATTSRRAFDGEISLARMRQAGAIVTTVESAIFELLVEARGELFKQVLGVVKQQTNPAPR